ncbi:hypothetical protein niasHT_024668 [Heterodera trifolii]|uniref:Bromo domain-containing protein n=1 Tax=Heterodera trifolii TaxID=157864 RepID=A0ABD2K7N7_9BILA
MKGTTRRKHRQPSLQDDSGSNNGGKTTPVPTAAATAAGPPEEWRLEAAIVSLLTLTDGDNRLICPPFRVLPTPTEFPLYYEHITNPIDLKCIAERARSGHYTDWAAIDADIQLLCQNTKDFSESGQMLRKDADLLLDHFKSRASEVAGARRFSARVLARNKEYIDELLRSTTSEVGEYSEDSEEDEDSERSNDPAWRLYWTIRNFDVVDGVPLCENFMELPSKTSYPDYYEEIPHPMSLYMINKKLKRGQYNGGCAAADGGSGTAAAPKQQHNQQLHGLVKDLLLMFDNACAYNIEESAIFEAAERLRKLTLQTVKKLDSTYKTNTSQKAIKQEVLDDDDIDEEENGEQQQQHQPHQNHSHPSPPPIVPKMNGTSAVVPPPTKRRKVGPKGGVVVDGAANAVITTNSSINATTDVLPVRRVVKREASAKGEQAIKRMVDSDFEEEEEDFPMNDHHHHHKQRAGMQNNHRHQPNNLKNGDISAAVPSSSSSTTTAPTVGATTATCANASSASVSHKRAPRRLNADGTPAERLKPGRKSVDELREKFAQKLTAVWQDVHNLKMGDRALAEPFEYLPCDKTFPDYYRTITKPISLMCIQRKIKEQLYADSDELLADLRQMFANARTFNKPDAQICADATILESVAVGSMRTHTEGVTLFYPYRRTDKGWSEKASIERSPLKMKRKGAILSTAPPTAASSSSSLSTNADGTNASTPSTTAATATTAGGTLSTATATISSATATADSQSATTFSAMCAQQQRSLAAASSSAVYVAPPLPPSSMCPALNNNNNAIASTSGAVYYAAGGGGYLVPQQQQQQQQFILHHHNAMPMAQAQPPQQFAAPHSVVHVQQQQQYLHQQQPMALTTSVKQLQQQQQQYHQSQQQQQYFSSTSALINGGGIQPNAALQQALHNGPIAAAVASSSCSASSSSSTVGPTVLFHLQQPQQQQLHHAQAVQQQYIQHHYGTNAEACAVGVQSPPPYSAGTVGLVGTNASSAQPNVQQMIIDPGRAVVNAMPKMALPVFVEPSASVKIQRVLHSEAYVRYIESMYSNKVQRTVSKWDKNLQATQRNTTAMPSSSSASSTSSSATAADSVFFDAINTSNGIDGKNRKQLAQQWIRLSSNGSRRREEVLMRALWTLRDQLIEGTVGVARHAELSPGEPPKTTATAGFPSSSNKNDRNNNNNNHNNSSARTGGGGGCSSWAGPSSSSAVAAAAEKR